LITNIIWLIFLLSFTHLLWSLYISIFQRLIWFSC